MFVYIQSYNIAVNMHASPVVPDCVRHFSVFILQKNRTFSTFDCLFVISRVTLNQNKIICESKCFKLIKKYDGCKA